jgi:hypothetical protein
MVLLAMTHASNAKASVIRSVLYILKRVEAIKLSKRFSTELLTRELPLWLISTKGKLMADESVLLTTTESRVLMHYRGACTCKWRGPWREFKGEAEADRDRHIKEHK